ncbi:hypothetical protein NUACC21_61420 [Scytonema sp. NUACC21]
MAKTKLRKAPINKVRAISCTCSFKLNLVAKYKPKEVIIKTSFILNNVKSGNSDQKNDIRDKTVNIQSKRSRLAVINVFFQ